VLDSQVSSPAFQQCTYKADKAVLQGYGTAGRLTVTAMVCTCSMSSPAAAAVKAADQAQS
jgi:hypothetical protein